MDAFWKVAIWSQFGAAVDMLENAIRACPDGLWSDPSKKPEWVEDDVVGFWYVAFHTLFFLDLYMSDSDDGFVPPDPFTLDELDPAGLLPNRPYTKDELLKYLSHCRTKTRSAIDDLTAERAQAHCGIIRFDFNRVELVLDVMRHVQHHAGQLNLLLRQHTESAPRWVSTSNVS